MPCLTTLSLTRCLSNTASHLPCDTKVINLDNQGAGRLFLNLTGMCVVHDLWETRKSKKNENRSGTQYRAILYYTKHWNPILH